MIKDMKCQLLEAGKIKIGEKGEERIAKGSGNVYRLPQKLDHFLVVQNRRDEAGNFIVDPVMQKLGEKPTSLNIMLMSDDIEMVFPTAYELYIGTSLKCRGDGETASRLNKAGEYETVECNSKTCGCRQKDAKTKCKPSGTLNCLLPDSDSLGGCYKFRTHGYNSVRGIMSSLWLIKGLTGGVLAWLPLSLKMNPKHVEVEEKGKIIKQTVYVAHVEYQGNPTMLLEKAMSVRKEQVERHINMQQLEQQAKQFLIGHDDAGDPEVGPEFYPENMEEENPFDKPGDVVTLDDKLKDNVSTSGEGDRINKIIDGMGKHGYTEMDIQRVLGCSVDDATEEELGDIESDIGMMDNGSTVGRWKA